MPCDERGIRHQKQHYSAQGPAPNYFLTKPTTAFPHTRGSNVVHGPAAKQQVDGILQFPILDQCCGPVADLEFGSSRPFTLFSVGSVSTAGLAAGAGRGKWFAVAAHWCGNGTGWPANLDQIEQDSAAPLPPLLSPSTALPLLTWRW